MRPGRDAGGGDPDDAAAIGDLGRAPTERRDERARVDARPGVRDPDRESAPRMRLPRSSTRALGGVTSFTQKRNVNRPAPARVALSKTIAYSPGAGDRAAATDDRA